MKKILVLSGGGVKGLIQMVALAKMENALGGQIAKNYDLIIGTSAGAINGGALALNIMTANQICNEYPAMIKEIFKRHFWPLTPKYDRQNFIKIWNKKFGNPQMKDCQIPFICTSVDRVVDLPRYFKSWEKEDGEENMCECICRSFAAPLFFGQLVDEKNKCVWLDGGCGTDNLPLDEALTESILQLWFKTEVIQFDIYGTGFSKEVENFDECKKGRWLKQVLDFMKPTDGGMARMMSRQEQLNRLHKICETNPTVRMNYYDIEIDKKHDKMDAVDLIDVYIKYGKEVQPIIIK